METRPPILPPGSPLLGQNHKTQSSFRTAVYTVVAVHVMLLVGIMIQGCKHSPKAGDQAALEAGAPSPTAITQLPAKPVAPPVEPPPSVAEAPAAAPPVIATAPLPTPKVEPAPAAVQALANTRDYVVTKGDTVSGIARKNGVSVRALLDLNPGVDPARLKIGQKLRVPVGSARVAVPPSAPPSIAAVRSPEPPARTHVVRKGDSLAGLAKTYRTTVARLKAANGLRSDRIVPGQKLKVPAGDPSPATSRTASVR